MHGHGIAAMSKAMPSVGAAATAAAHFPRGTPLSYSGNHASRRKPFDSAKASPVLRVCCVYADSVFVDIADCL